MSIFVFIASICKQGSETTKMEWRAVIHYKLCIVRNHLIVIFVESCMFADPKTTPCSHTFCKNVSTRV